MDLEHAAVKKTQKKVRRSMTDIWLSTASDTAARARGLKHPRVAVAVAISVAETLEFGG